MQSCAKCRITVRGNKRCCPLCGGQLTGEPEAPAFPYLEERKVSRITVVRITGFAMILFLAVMLLIQFIIGHMVFWMPLAAVICGIIFVDVWAAATLIRNVLKMITSQMCTGMLLCVIIDAYFGWIGWSVAFVLPIASLVLILITFLVNLVSRVELQDFAMYLVFDFIICYIQVVFLLLKLNPFPLPAVLSLTITTLVFLAILIFFRKDFWSASRRYFNT